MKSVSCLSSRVVDIRGLKLWAADVLPRASNLKAVLFIEEDVMSVDAYLAKVPIWLKLLDLEVLDG